MFINEYLGDRPTSESKTGLHVNIHNQIPLHENAGWLDQLSSNTVESILSELGDFDPRITNAIEQTGGGGAIEHIMPPPTIEVDNSSSEALPTPVFILPDFFSI